MTFHKILKCKTNVNYKIKKINVKFDVFVVHFYGLFKKGDHQSENMKTQKVNLNFLTDFVLPLLC